MPSVEVLKALKGSVVLFPGQGTQHVGMARNLCDKGKSLFEMANHVLGYDLLKLCNNGPEKELDRTVHSQPAIFVTSLAAAENLASRSRGAVENCVATAGFSLGEYSSLVFAQSIDFIDALRLVKLRAEVTQRVADEIPSGMMSIIYGANGKPNEACQLASEYCIRSGLSKEESICSVATQLFPHCKVVGGHQKALDFIEQNFKDFGIRRTKRLAVSGAFHTKIMRPAETDLKLALSKMTIKEPAIPVYSNVTAKAYSSPKETKEMLVRHLTQQVRWETSMKSMYADARKKIVGEETTPVTFECGPQDTLTNILGMIDLKAKRQAFNINCD